VPVDSLPHSLVAATHRARRASDACAAQALSQPCAARALAYTIAPRTARADGRAASVVSRPKTVIADATGLT
jgi:hypothetical protein